MCPLCQQCGLAVASRSGEYYEFGVRDSTFEGINKSVAVNAPRRGNADLSWKEKGIHDTAMPCTIVRINLRDSRRISYRVLMAFIESYNQRLWSNATYERQL
jgi:hypothetical protein